MNSCAWAARAAASMALRAGLGHPVGDISRDRVVEEHGLLRDDADLAAQRGQRDVAHVVAIDAARAPPDTS